MLVDTDSLVSLTEANQNFSRVTRMVDDRGAVVIMRNNQPKYLVMEFAEVKAASQADTGDSIASDDEVMAAAAKYIKKHHRAFEELAK